MTILLPSTMSSTVASTSTNTASDIEDNVQYPHARPSSPSSKPPSNAPSPTQQSGAPHRRYSTTSAKRRLLKHLTLNKLESRRSEDPLCSRDRSVLIRANRWAQYGIESTMSAYSQLHTQLGLPPLTPGMWTQALVRMCRDAGILV